MSWPFTIILFFGYVVLLANGAKQYVGSQAQKGINRKALQGKLKVIFWS